MSATKRVALILSGGMLSSALLRALLRLLLKRTSKNVQLSLQALALHLGKARPGPRQLQVQLRPAQFEPQQGRRTAARAAAPVARAWSARLVLPVHRAVAVRALLNEVLKTVVAVVPMLALLNEVLITSLCAATEAKQEAGVSGKIPRQVSWARPRASQAQHGNGTRSHPEGQGPVRHCPYHQNYLSGP